MKTTDLRFAHGRTTLVAQFGYFVGPHADREWRLFTHLRRLNRSRIYVKQAIESREGGRRSWGNLDTRPVPKNRTL
jgi:hypothetical protein